MICAFFSLLMLIGGVISLSYLAWCRVSAHLKEHPEASKIFVEHVVAPMLLGNKEEPEEEPKA